MNKDKIRNILNIIFMIGAVVAMCFKIAESSMRMIK